MCAGCNVGRHGRFFAFRRYRFDWFYIFIGRFYLCFDREHWLKPRTYKQDRGSLPYGREVDRGLFIGPFSFELVGRRYYQ